MRVIAGSARSLPLKTVKGDGTRPTTDRIKETLFNMLNPYLSSCRFLDLFSGSGAIGIEALSRGAAFACFVESSREAARCITSNLEFTKLKTRSQLCVKDVFSFLSEGPSDGKPYDIIFMDPPYDRDFEKRALTILASSGFIKEGTLIVCEGSLKTGFSYTEELGFNIIKTKKYKTNQHVFLLKEGTCDKRTETL